MTRPVMGERISLRRRAAIGCEDRAAISCSVMSSAASFLSREIEPQLRLREDRLRFQEKLLGGDLLLEQPLLALEERDLQIDSSRDAARYSLLASATSRESMMATISPRATSSPSRLRNLLDDAGDFRRDAGDPVGVGLDGGGRGDAARDDAGTDRRRLDLRRFDLIGSELDLGVAAGGLALVFVLRGGREAAAQDAEKRRRRSPGRKARDDGENENGPVAGHCRPNGLRDERSGRPTTGAPLEPSAGVAKMGINARPPLICLLKHSLARVHARRQPDAAAMSVGCAKRKARPRGSGLPSREGQRRPLHAAAGGPAGSRRIIAGAARDEQASILVVKVV